MSVQIHQLKLHVLPACIAITACPSHHITTHVRIDVLLISTSTTLTFVIPDGDVFHAECCAPNDKVGEEWQIDLIFSDSDAHVLRQFPETLSFAPKEFGIDFPQ